MKNLWLFNENKLLILRSLYKCGDDICGCDLIDKLEIPKNLLSYHMKTLRDGGIVSEIKCGTRKNYLIRKEKIKFVRDVLKFVELL
ncbi:MAG: ArsR family transcriptional regulator [Patescibacteria group bacterium]|nr:ArsR family transcriptional regulator [Patescibacteria group bacterium]